MIKKREQDFPLRELDDDDKARITEVFFEEEVSRKLKMLHARNGILNCSFAGEQYKNWNIHFRSSGSDFYIVEFEYDEDSAGMGPDDRVFDL